LLAAVDSCTDKTFLFKQLFCYAHRLYIPEVVAGLAA
jgi:hypothetical protein